MLAHAPAAAALRALRRLPMLPLLRTRIHRLPLARLQTCRPAVQQPLLEGLLLLADKYDMAVLLARAAAELLAPARHFSMDPAAPNFALR